MLLWVRLAQPLEGIPNKSRPVCSRLYRGSCRRRVKVWQSAASPHPKLYKFARRLTQLNCCFMNDDFLLTLSERESRTTPHLPAVTIVSPHSCEYASYFANKRRDLRAQLTLSWSTAGSPTSEKDTEIRQPIT